MGSSPAPIRTVAARLPTARSRKRLRRLAKGTICSNQRLNGVTVEYELKKPSALLSQMKGSFNWRSHRDSNPGYSRERGVS